MELLFYFIGLVSGMFGMWISKGNFTLTIVKKQQREEAAGYNESLVNELDPEVRSYYEQTHGMNKF